MKPKKTCKKKIVKRPETFLVGFNSNFKSDFKSNFNNGKEPKITRSDVEELCDAMLPELKRRIRRLYRKEMRKSIRRPIL